MFVAGIISLCCVQSTSNNKPLDELLLRSAEILEKGMTKEEKKFLSQMPLSCTVQWLQIKKREVFSGNEYDSLCNNPDFWKFANKRFKIVHTEEFYFTVVCVVYYYELNKKDWNSAMCFDAAADLAGAPKKSNLSKQNAKP